MTITIKGGVSIAIKIFSNIVFLNHLESTKFLLKETLTFVKFFLILRKGWLKILCSLLVSETKRFLLDLRRCQDQAGGLLLVVVSQTNDGKIFGTVRNVKYYDIRWKSWNNSEWTEERLSHIQIQQHLILMLLLHLYLSNHSVLKHRSILFDPLLGKCDFQWHPGEVDYLFWKQLGTTWQQTRQLDK